MTIKERVHSLVNADIDLCDESPASVEKMIVMAYYIGTEEATRNVAKKYTDLIAEQRKRANDCRYKYMANRVIGDQDYIYTAGFDLAMTCTFGSDKADI